MPHYFSEESNDIKSNPKVIAFRVHETNFTCTTDHGVFAKDGLDRGTEILLKYVKVEDGKNVLDLGCGYGTIGLVMAKVFDKTVDMVDVNKRAIDLATKNVLQNGVTGNVFYSNGFQNITTTYDMIITNPPIRIGKKAMYQLLSDAKNYLKDTGTLQFVINKKHGALSAIKFVETIYSSVKIVGKQKGFYVINCKK